MACCLNIISPRINCLRWLHLLQISFQLLRLRFIRNEANHRLARQAISEQLGEMGGIAMKIGQLVADVGQAEELRDLLDREKARPLTEMLPVLEQELGQPVEAIFKNIEPSRKIYTFHVTFCSI